MMFVKTRLRLLERRILAITVELETLLKFEIDNYYLMNRLVKARQELAELKRRHKLLRANLAEYEPSIEGL